MKLYTAIGLMSGTSMDGVDAVLVETDGHNHRRLIDFVSVSYDDAFKGRLRECLNGGSGDNFVRDVEQDLTRMHASAVQQLLQQAKYETDSVDVIGFHGHSLAHDPDKGMTWQIGDGAVLAKETGIAVVNDFRTADVKNGGQGAPLLPIYHRALASDWPKPCVILNIGGVANITWLGEDESDIIAFDTGPGNALIDDYVRQRYGRPYDPQGMIAARGSVNSDILMSWLDHPYFEKKPPKSLDRGDFDGLYTGGIPYNDTVATLTAFTVECIAIGIKQHCQKVPEFIGVGGGGRHNKTMMDMLAERLNVPVKSVDDKGWNGDSLEAEGFAYMAVRHLLELPTSLPAITGVEGPVIGGVFHK